MEEHELLRRAAVAVVRSIDHEASFYEAQSPVEDWALDALGAAIGGDLSGAESLLDRYERAGWEERRSYAISEWDEACPGAARAVLPVTPPLFEHAHDGNPLPATANFVEALTDRGQ
jgi:hypothetical protein